MIVAEREKCFNIGIDRKENLPQSGVYLNIWLQVVIDILSDLASKE